MAKSPKKPKPEEIEIEPDAWPRFEQFIRDVAKAGPQHRSKSVPPKRRKPKPKEKALVSGAD